MLIPFNTYTTYDLFRRDWTVKQLEDQVKNGYVPEGFPIDGDATTISLKDLGL